MNSVSPLSISPQSVATLSPSLATAAKLSGKSAKAAHEFRGEPDRFPAPVDGKNLRRSPRRRKHDAGRGRLQLSRYPALAEGLAARGGFGIAAMISQHLPAHEGNR